MTAKAISTFTTLPLALLALVQVACATRAPESGSPRDEEVAPPPPAASPVTRADVLTPRPTAFVAEEYGAVEDTYRLFGVELGDGSSPPSAVIANTRTWSTESVTEGASFGRGHQIARVDARGVTIRFADGHETTLAPGENLALRVVRHRLDIVARPLGRDRFAIDPAATRALGAAAEADLPTSEPVELFGQTLVRLGPLATGSLLAEAGLREGDLLAALDDVPASSSTVRDLTRALVDARANVRVRLYRGGVPMERRYLAR